MIVSGNVGIGTTTMNVCNVQVQGEAGGRVYWTDAVFDLVQPSMNLDFLNRPQLDPRISFTRASNATVFNSIGVLTTVGYNRPRFDYNPSTGECNGLLIEQSSVNLLTYSSAIGGTNWSSFGTAPTLTLNAAVAPDGTTTATKSVPGTAAGFYDTTQLFSYTAGSYYTLSVWVKQSGTGYTIIHLQMYDGNATYGGYPGAWIQITGNGSVLSTSNGMTASNASATVTAYPNGWYRCTLSGIPSSASSPSTSNYAVIRPSLVNGDSWKGSGGDGTSGYYYWGAQVEQLAFATSYIATTNATATRPVDQANVSVGSWYNQQSGTLYVETNRRGQGGTASFSAALYTDSNNYIGLQYVSASGTYTGQVYDANVSTAVSVSPVNVSNVDFGTNMRTAVSFDAVSNIMVVTNKGVSTTFGGTFPGVPIVTSLTIGGRTIGGDFTMTGYMRKLAYYPARLSNATVQSMTLI